MEWVSSMLKKLIVVIHLTIMLSFLAIWTWLSWKYVAILGLIYIAFEETCNGCVLSHYQFKDKDKENTKFYEWCLSKIGIKNYNREHLFIFVRYYLPLILVVLGILFQDVLGVIKPFV